METDPATLVTGTPTGLKSPRVGDVLVERFEITEAVESDCLIHTYQANDQETDASVLVRVTAPGLLGEKDARRLVERMRVHGRKNGTRCLISLRARLTQEQEQALHRG